MEAEMELLEAARALRGRGEPAVLATLVAVEGSSVRRPGARLLLLPGGRLAGFLSAGCVERDLAERVDRVLVSARSELVRYAAAETADPVLGLGLGCGGGMEVLLEPWPPLAGPDPLELLESVRQRRKPAALATVVNPPERRGARVAVGPGEATPSGAPDELGIVLDRALRGMLPEPDRGVVREGGLDILVERLFPPLRVLVQGVTPPARAMVALAGDLGWQAVILDPGSGGEWAPEGVPVVRALGKCLPEDLEPDPWTVAVLLAHDTDAEARVAPLLLAAGVPYVGVMGSRRRREDLIRRLRESAVSEESLDRVFMPVGLDLGAEKAGEIALAAAAEILAVVRGRSGGRLRNIEGRLHGP